MSEQQRKLLGFTSRSWQYHPALGRWETIQVEFRRNGDNVELHALDGLSLQRLTKIPTVSIPIDEFSERSKDPYDKSIEVDWVCQKIGCTHRGERRRFERKNRQPDDWLKRLHERADEFFHEFPHEIEMLLAVNCVTFWLRNHAIRDDARYLLDTSKEQVERDVIKFYHKYLVQELLKTASTTPGNPSYFDLGYDYAIKKYNCVAILEHEKREAMKSFLHG